MYWSFEINLIVNLKHYFLWHIPMFSWVFICCKIIRIFAMYSAVCHRCFLYLCLGMSQTNTDSNISSIIYWRHHAFFLNLKKKRRTYCSCSDSAFYPPSTGIICLQLPLWGPSKYCYFSTLQPLSCSTRFSFQWIKAKCVYLLSATGTLGMNFKQGTQTS